MGGGECDCVCVSVIILVHNYVCVIEQYKYGLARQV